jgi:hypothetical protein
VNDTIESIKRRARILSRTLDEGHRTTLDRIARAAGHSHWGSYARSIADTDDVVIEAVRMPILLQATLSRRDLSAIAFNQDGSQWARSDAGWKRVDPRHVDPLDQTRSFIESLSTNPSTMSFALLPGGHRLAAMITHDAFTGAISIRHPGPKGRGATASSMTDSLVRTGTAHSAPLLHIVEHRGEAGRRAAIRLLHDATPPSARIALIDVPRTDVDRENVWSLSTSAVGMGARDLAMRSCADASMVSVGDETTAVIAADLAYHNGHDFVIACVDPEGARKERLIRAIVDRMERYDMDSAASIRMVA